MAKSKISREGIYGNSESKVTAVTSILEHERVPTQNLSFALADLTKEDDWDKAMKGIDKVIHVASPLSGNNHENPELIPIAESGVRNVLNAAVRAGVSKVVMTSSQAACYPDKKCTGPAVNETFWTTPDNRQNYTQLTTILPSAIWGPYMDGKRGSTDMIFEMLLKGTPSPNVIYPVVDVRDLADLHILAMENPAADGERFIAQSEELTMPEMAKFQSPMKVLNTMIGLHYHNDTSKANRVLGWIPRPAKETALSMIFDVISSLALKSIRVSIVISKTEYFGITSTSLFHLLSFNIFQYCF